MSCSRVFAATTARERHKSRTSRMPHPLSQIVAAAIAGALIIATAGCSPGPSPTPTPTPAFTDEADAFAAAEKVYRAYNDALNARRQGDVTADPQQYLTGAALEGDIDAMNSLVEWGLESTGNATVRSFRGVEFRAGSQATTVSGLVCVDVSQVRVINASGEDVTPSERGEIVAQQVTFTGAPDGVLVSDEASAEETSC
ncbi:hypothetical protein [Microbacterium foliorum]|uniref:hypothetical protein n=1 Tax=Microbacterium foliorum TaxID=104336 RepID=UPI001D5AE076|nr:hypothetical protein [Microbacterium foliorum]CAH0156157.1 hypothetical protein SRABI03_00887 [Microbacterium foliorum]CAH0173876.1 hypothetical protein SRABI44_01274 [Microbacterium foliorum]